MPFFDTKPSTIEAFQYDGTDQSFRVIAKWIEDNGLEAEFTRQAMPGGRVKLQTALLSCDIEKGDWIIRNDIGTLFMCDDEAFQRKFCPAEEVLDPAGGSHERPLGD